MGEEMLFKKRKFSVHFRLFPTFPRSANAVGPYHNKSLSGVSESEMHYVHMSCLIVFWFESQMELERKIVETEKQYEMSMTRQLAFGNVQPSHVDREKLLTEVDVETLGWNLLAICLTLISVLIVYLHKRNDEWMDEQLFQLYFGNDSHIVWSRSDSTSFYNSRASEIWGAIQQRSNFNCN